MGGKSAHLVLKSREINLYYFWDPSKVVALLRRQGLNRTDLRNRKNILFLNKNEIPVLQTTYGKADLVSQ